MRNAPFFLPLLPIVLAGCAAARVPASPDRRPPDRPPPARTADAPASITTRFTVLTQDRPSGFETITRQGSSLRAHYEYADRGRGPSFDVAYTFDEAGFITSFDANGTDYRHKPLEERFRLDGTKASWRSRSDEGSADWAHDAMYLPIDAAPGFEALALAALRHHEGTLPLLPDGEARLRFVGSQTVARSQAPGSETRSVKLLEVSGLWLSPTYVWFDEDDQPFADVSAWFSTVREGWESVVPALVETQNRHVSERSKATAARLRSAPPEAGIAFTNAKVFDSVGKRVNEGMTVVVRGNRIEQVGSSRQVKLPKGIAIRDIAGRTIVPGLWDMHVHAEPETLLLELASGVTSIRDLGNDVDDAIRLRKEIDEGEALGPRMLLAGFIDGSGPFTGPTGLIVNSEAEGHAAIERFAANGYSQLKIYNSIKPSLVSYLVREAKSHGLRVSGHVPFGMVADDAIDAGFDEINHVNFLFRGLTIKKGEDTFDKTTPFEAARRAAVLDVDGAPMRALIARLRAKHIVIDPTLGVFEGTLTHRPGQVSPAVAPIADRLPAALRRAIKASPAIDAPPGSEATLETCMHQYAELTRRLFEAGVPIVAGTDNEFGGIAFDRELELYVEAGIPAKDVLALATIGSARIMKKDSELGAITPGRLADLTIVDGDPTLDIANIRKVVTVVKDGYVYDAAQLLEAAGIAPSRR